MLFFPDFKSRADAIFGALDPTVPPLPAALVRPDELNASLGATPARPWSVSETIRPFERGAPVRPRLPPHLRGQDGDDADESEEGSEHGSSEEDEDRPDPMLDDVAPPNPDDDEDSEDESEGRLFSSSAARRPRPGRKQLNEFGEQARMSKRYARAVDQEAEEDEFDVVAQARDPTEVLTQLGTYAGGEARPARDTEVPLEGNLFERRCRDLEGQALEDVAEFQMSSGHEPGGSVDHRRFRLPSGKVVDLGLGEGDELPWARGREEGAPGPSAAIVHRGAGAAGDPRGAGPRPRSALKGARVGEDTAAPVSAAADSKPAVQRQRSVRFSEGADVGAAAEGAGPARRPPPPRGRTRGPVGFSYVPDHVKNPAKYTVYELDETVTVGNGYRDFGVRDASARADATPWAGQKEIERALVAAAGAAAAARASQRPSAASASVEKGEEEGVRPSLPLEPSSGAIVFRPQAGKALPQGKVRKAGGAASAVPFEESGAWEKEEEEEGNVLALPIGRPGAGPNSMGVVASGSGTAGRTFKQRGAAGGSREYRRQAGAGSEGGRDPQPIIAMESALGLDEMMDE